METAVIVRSILYHSPDCGIGDSNDAEWLALIHALGIAKSIGARDVCFLGDSALVVSQAGGLAKCRSLQYRSYLERVLLLAKDFERIRIRKIPRNQNLAGIALARQQR